MKKEVAKHFVLVNGVIVGDLLNAEVARILVDALSVKLANEKNVEVRYVKQTSEIDIPDPKPADKAVAKEIKKLSKEELKKKN